MDDDEFSDAESMREAIFDMYRRAMEDTSLDNLADEPSLYVKAHYGNEALERIAEDLEDATTDSGVVRSDELSDEVRTALFIMQNGFNAIREAQESDDDDDNPFKVSDGDDPIY